MMILSLLLRLTDRKIENNFNFLLSLPPLKNKKNGREKNNNNNKVELGKRKGGAAAGHRNRFVLIPIFFCAFPICWQRNLYFYFIFFCLCFFSFSSPPPFSISIDIYIRSSFLLFRDIEMSRTRMAERNPESRGVWKEIFLFWCSCTFVGTNGRGLVDQQKKKQNLFLEIE